MKKILFFIHDLGQGGAEKVLVNLANHLDKTKFEVSIISLFGGGVNERFLDENVHYHVIFKKSFRGNSWLMKLLSPQLLHIFIIKGKYDIEIAFLEGPSARIISGCPDKETKCLCWIHSEQKDADALKCGFRNYSEALKCYHRFDNVVCVSQSVMNAFKNTAHIKTKAQVLYNTVESDSILSLSKETVEDYEFGNAITLISVGSLKPVKGFDRLIRVVRRLTEKGLNVNLIILGIGPLQDKLKKYAKDNSIGNRVSFLGYQTNPYKYVRNSDIYVCSSISEGFSTAVTEALIVGTPVCTVDVPGMKEMLGENEFGIVTENNEDALFDGLYNLLCNREELQYYQVKALERGTKFSTKETVAAVEALFESV